MDRYAVIGHPISHSKSPIIHQQFAKQTQQKMEYSPLLGPLEDIDDYLTQFFLQGGKGCNVTVPFKEAAFSFAQTLTARAALAGAVNTLKITEQGVITGDNTDGAGLVDDLQRLHFPLHNARILLLGAGGAARGALHPLLEHNPQSLTIANRTYSRAQALQQLCQQAGFQHVHAAHYHDLNRNEFDLIINATASGLKGDTPPLASELISEKTACYDMFYAPTLTPFLIWAKAQGARQYADGLGMLVAQAAHAFMYWRGVMPQKTPVIQYLQQQSGNK
ncbi:MAG: shikimate dehydrogenase [Plesiomonas sp.]